MKKILNFSSWSAIIIGLILLGAGIWGIYFTYENVSREMIVTPSDASIPDTAVRGPLTLKSQADIIRVHALRSAGGETYAEMPRLIPKTDSLGEIVLDEEGEAVMISNESRNIWITATTLVTALTLAIVVYAFFALILLLGLILIFAGFVCCALSRKLGSCGDCCDDNCSDCSDCKDCKDCSDCSDCKKCNHIQGGGKCC